MAFPAAATDPPADTLNGAGGLAYRLPPKEALAQLAATGCFHNTHQASGQEQLAEIRKLALQLDAAFVTKVAVYASQRGLMKSAPTLLLAVLSDRLTVAAWSEDAAYRAGDRARAARHGAEVRRLSALFSWAFPRVIDTAKKLRTYVRLVRSGEGKRRSLGTALKRAICAWLEARTPEQLFRASVGNAPSLADIVAMAHPAPSDRKRAALYGYLRGRPTARFGGEEFRVLDEVPDEVRRYEMFKKARAGSLPRGVPYEMLEGLELTTEQWMELAVQATWQQTRQHLMSFGRKGVYRSAEVVQKLADKLADREQIRRARAMPYQLLVAHGSGQMPARIKQALHDAMEIATENVPVIDGLVAVLPDVSGSMHSPVTGTQYNPRTGLAESHTSSVKCVDVASLVAASVLRRNPHAIVLPFADFAMTSVKLDPRASILSNAEKLMALPSGGTSCSAPLWALDRMGLAPDLVWFVSDNESWIDSARQRAHADPTTASLTAWRALHRRNPLSKLVCLDLQPTLTTQAPSRPEILNIGGFSDVVFEAVAAFRSGMASSWVEMIENSVDLPSELEPPGRQSHQDSTPPCRHPDRPGRGCRPGSTPRSMRTKDEKM